jgi:hypothetical protein
MADEKQHSLLRDAALVLVPALLASVTTFEVAKVNLKAVLESKQGEWEVEKANLNSQLQAARQLEEQKAHETMVLEEFKSASQHQDLYIKEVRDHDAKVTSLRQQLLGKYWIPNFSNKCSSPVDIAVRYVALDGETVVEGWWTVEPGSSLAPFVTISSRFYYHGHTSDRKYEWTGASTFDVSLPSSAPYGYYALPTFTCGS